MSKDREFSYLCGMRETFKLIITAIAVAIFVTSCGGNYKDAKMSSFTLKELNVTGLRSICGIADVGVSNPAERFKISKVAATLKTSDGEQIVNVFSEGFSVAAKCDSVYTVGFEASLPNNITPIWLVDNLKSFDPEKLLIDFSMKFTARSGIGTTLSYKDMPLKNFDNLK